MSLLDTPAGSQWSRIGIKHHHGIVVPLFALHSRTSSGIGEYGDLFSLIPWCKELGLDVIQLLPLNDTGIDTSPYNALSAFALNPIHLSLSQLPYLEKTDLDWQKLAQLNQSQRIDYSKVQEEKRRFLKQYIKEVGQLITTTQDYKNFVDTHEWLFSYALFKTLKEHFKWKPWAEWEEHLKNPTSATLQNLYKQYSEEISYHILLQYLSFQQLQSVQKKASEFGIFLKGDIPILINRESADVWLHRPLFHMQYSAGSAPDMYSKEGQNWGFPVYNWSELEKTGYKWWKNRLKTAESLYNIYRLDHLVGFFRIWAIPYGRPGREGDYLPQDPNVWIPSGKKIMQMMLQNSTMFPIAEDLGNVPPLVRVCLKEMGICGTKVVRWERKWDEDSRFIPYHEYSPESMTTVSTHDSDTLQLWWKHSPEEAKVFAAFSDWQFTPELDKEHHQEILYQSHHTNSLFHINLLQEYLVLIPNMTWPNPQDERINIPGTHTSFNWSYRFRPSVEEIISNDSLRAAMRAILS